MEKGCAMDALLTSGNYSAYIQILTGLMHKNTKSKLVSIKINFMSMRIKLGS